MLQEKIPWSAISSQLKGDANPKQIEILNQWLNESAENTSIHQDIINGWQLTRNKSEIYQPDMDMLWAKLIRRTNLKSKVRLFNIDQYKWIAAAAIIVVVFLAGNWFGKIESSTNMVYASVISPAGSRSKIILPDSTSVWLNAGAEIRYPSSFSRETRDVYISGECFFNVTKDKKRQFIVHSNSLDIKVFGTSFNVRENEKDNKTEVALIEGEVQIFNSENRPLVSLTPGEQFTLTGDIGVVEKVDNINNLTAWKENMIIFENEPFDQVIQSLESWYGVEFEVDTSILNNHNYTFKVKTESIREVLNLISVITPIEYNISGENVTIKYKSI